MQSVNQLTIRDVGTWLCRISNFTSLDALKLAFLSNYAIIEIYEPQANNLENAQNT